MSIFIQPATTENIDSNGLLLFYIMKLFDRFYFSVDFLLPIALHRNDLTITKEEKYYSTQVTHTFIAERDIFIR